MCKKPLETDVCGVLGRISEDGRSARYFFVRCLWPWPCKAPKSGQPMPVASKPFDSLPAEDEIPMRATQLVFVGLSLVFLAEGCKPKRPQEPARYYAASAQDLQKPTGILRPDENPVTAAGGTPLQATLGAGLALVGVQMPGEAKLGGEVKLRTWWRWEEPLSQEDVRELRVFVHGQVPGAELNQVQADHRLAMGRLPLDALMPGDIVEDVVAFRIPAALAANQLDIHVGLYQGKKRWSVNASDVAVRKDRILVGQVRITDAPPLLPRAVAKRRKAEIQIDGLLDEPDWAEAAELGPFYAYDGKRRVRNQTRARLLWDDAHLYVAFICDDDDIHTPYTKRDDPLYESEAVEIFIDADGDADEYVELQAAANDVHFDAAFAGGRRKNFDTGYNVNYETRTSLQGTLNQPGDQDRAWISEWKIPIAELRDVETPPAPGVSWRINLFRLDRRRKGERVVGTEASAWSSPLSGDFHHLQRFGTLEFAL